MKFALTLASVILLAACTPTGDTTIAGRFGPDNPIALNNLTVIDGSYRVAYTMAIYVASSGAPVHVTCDVIDVSGRLDDLPGLSRGVASNRWVRLTEIVVLELPDATLGIRCFPDRVSDLTVVVRDVKLSAEPLD